ncbi:hypothetical protein PR048_024033 [Dryococelus australis]|uniref:Uncharacterized protein n=1 Tax=Dryococelus australis TaxID=614101 RepID=A0ABQ9GVR7_9NEOP|nr:hypothetical protein PR048_024033 [Dryococelus australis]
MRVPPPPPALAGVAKKHGNRALICASSVLPRLLHGAGISTALFARLAPPKNVRTKLVSSKYPLEGGGNDLPNLVSACRFLTTLGYRDVCWYMGLPKALKTTRTAWTWGTSKPVSASLISSRSTGAPRSLAVGKRPAHVARAHVGASSIATRVHVPRLNVQTVMPRDEENFPPVPSRLRTRYGASSVSRTLDSVVSLHQSATGTLRIATKQHVCSLNSIPRQTCAAMDAIVTASVFGKRRDNLFQHNRRMCILGKVTSSHRIADITPSAHRFTVLTTANQGASGVLLSNSKYRNRIRLERASQKQSSDAHRIPYYRVKLCLERTINIKASERVNVDPLVHTVFDASWRTMAQLLPSAVTAGNQFAVHTGIFVHKSVGPSLQVIELANFSVLCGTFSDDPIISLAKLFVCKSSTLNLHLITSPTFRSRLVLHLSELRDALGSNPGKTGNVGQPAGKFTVASCGNTASRWGPRTRGRLRLIELSTRAGSRAYQIQKGRGPGRLIICGRDEEPVDRQRLIIHFLPSTHSVEPTSALGRTGFNPRPGHSQIFACVNRAGRCRWSVVFSRGYLVSPRPLIPALLLTDFDRPHRLSRPCCSEPPESLHSLKPDLVEDPLGWQNCFGVRSLWRRRVSIRTCGLRNLQWLKPLLPHVIRCRRIRARVKSTRNERTLGNSYTPFENRWERTRKRRPEIPSEVVNQWTRTRQELTSKPGPVTLISVFHGFPKSFQANVNVIWHCDKSSMRRECTIVHCDTETKREYQVGEKIRGEAGMILAPARKMGTLAKRGGERDRVRERERQRKRERQLDVRSEANHRLFQLQQFPSCTCRRTQYFILLLCLTASLGGYFHIECGNVSENAMLVSHPLPRGFLLQKAISDRQFQVFEMNFISISSPALNSNGATVFCVDLRPDLGSSFKPRWCNRALASYINPGIFVTASSASSIARTFEQFI